MTEPKKQEENRVAQLEEEKEHLTSSLFSLTTRFAQIQFRLHQITESSPEERDHLLKELEEFAHKGCVDQQIVKSQPSEVRKQNTSSDEERKTMTQELKEKHEIIINELKAQLNDFESFAFKQGAGSVPQSVQLEKQQALLEQLTQKLNLQVNEDDFAHTSVDDLRNRVDEAVAEIVNPAKIKGRLVDHLQTQIQDLERFVEFLQEAEGKFNYQYIVYAQYEKSSGSVPNPTTGNKTSDRKKSERRQAMVLVRRAMAIIQMFSIAQFGCGGRPQPEETIVDTKSLIDNLKRAVNHARVCDGESETETSSVSSYEDDTDRLNLVTDELTQLVRGELYAAIIDILGNGLVHDAIGGHGSSLISPISCLLPRKPMHPWELFLEYYEVKNGPEFARSPSRMLSRSFNLDDLVASGDTSRSKIAKHSLLEAIHLVVKDHDPLKRGYDAMFK
uniref:RUN domain-containing protein n=1 Tax=Ciona intestinalis TaxID=7719 RepID=F6RU88_CIOIN